MRISWTGRRRQRLSLARSPRAAPGRRPETPRVVNGRTPDDARSAADRKARVEASGAAETPAPLVAAGQGNAGAGPLAQVGRRDGGRFQPKGCADCRQGREVRGNRQAEAAEPSQAAPVRCMRHGVSAAQRGLYLLLQAMRRPGPERKDRPAETIRRAFELRCAGKSYWDIADILDIAPDRSRHYRQTRARHFANAWARRSGLKLPAKPRKPRQPRTLPET